MKKYKVRYGGAQIPVSTNIQKNKIEILKAIDWAKENEVTNLLTPEGSLSGWNKRWASQFDEVKSYLTEIEQYAEKSGVGLHIGTMFKENDIYGEVQRNEIRHYTAEGNLTGVTFKTFVINEHENSLGRESWSAPIVFPIVLETDDEQRISKHISGAGLICNDMWGSNEAGKENLVNAYRELNLAVIFHATNGVKDYPEEVYKVFNAWHNGHLLMTSYSSRTPILTVDSCTPWEWDGEDESIIDMFPTSSESGFIDITKYATDVPRKGRQYFYHDVEYEE